MNDTKRPLIITSLSIASVFIMIAIYFVPIWWVALTAPNYPETAFPDGVRINFHMNGVFNGCSLVVKDEIIEEEALDCVHEMDTINHYVGMYPIAAGGPIERGFSNSDSFLFASICSAKSPTSFPASESFNCFRASSESTLFTLPPKDMSLIS